MIAGAIAAAGLVAACEQRDAGRALREHQAPSVQREREGGSGENEREAGHAGGERETGSEERGEGEAASWASAPPAGLVDLRAAVDDLCFDIRYATDRNFTGAVLPGYEAAGAWLRREAAGGIARAQASLRPHGIGLLVYDAYRPRRATKAMVAWARASGREDLIAQGFIAEDSAHARGRAIDVGLCDLETRAALDLGTDFDAFVPQARHGGVAGEAAERRAMLRDALRAAGFTPYAREWWHYSMKTERPGAALDVPYTAAP